MKGTARTRSAEPGNDSAHDSAVNAVKKKKLFKK